jgi:phage host-nuclease inhibitor protein Gam
MSRPKKSLKFSSASLGDLCAFAVKKSSSPISNPKSPISKIMKSILSKLRLTPITSRDEATAIAAATAQLTLVQERAALQLAERLESVKLEYNLQIEEYGREIEKNTKRLGSWALLNRATEFGTRQSITLAGHKLSFREGTGKVEFAPSIKESDALDNLLSLKDESTIERFISIKASLSKTAVLTAWRTSESLKSILTSCGITVTKDEKFSFEPDRDALPEATSITTNKSAA